MMKSDDTASFLYGMAKRGRKYYLGLATITLFLALSLAGFGAELGLGVPVLWAITVLAPIGVAITVAAFTAFMSNSAGIEPRNGASFETRHVGTDSPPSRRSAS